ncbi:MAG: AAA family ATPase [Rectinemataceae bacterium]
MIEKIVFDDWRSFEEASLPIDQLTVLIGANASGKSNALDGIEFLRQSALGRDFTSIFKGEVGGRKGLRGGLEWAARKPEKRFSLGVIVQDKVSKERYEYKIAIRAEELRAVVENETLARLRKDGKTTSIFHTDPIEPETPSIVGVLYNGKSGSKQDYARSSSLLSQINKQVSRKEITDAVAAVVKDLASIFVLDPVPSLMRGFTPLSETLEPDGSNIAGLVAALAPQEKKRFEGALKKYIKELPERDIVRVFAERVGKLQTDALLYCEERWKDGEAPILVDSRGMSDGTLRFLAIITALMTRPAGSLLIIEEIDNGLHPSRSGALMRVLKELSTSREIDIIVTTHNPAFLNACGPEMLPFIVMATRESETGASILVLLEDLEGLDKLMARGSLGTLSEQGYLERALQRGVSR